MKLNVFRLFADQIDKVENKLLSRKMTILANVEQDGWQGKFYFCADPEPAEVTWADEYQEYFADLPMPMNKLYYAGFIFQREKTCFFLSYGKTHFYVRPFCDYDFGIELAKRIADEGQISQTASRRFQGKRKKDIRSFAPNTALDIESGESVDFLQASVVSERRDCFGKAGKFGASALLSIDITARDLGKFLTRLEATLNQPPRFRLPRTIILKEADEIERCDNLLLDEIQSGIGTTEFVHNSYDLYGVDFIFSNTGGFRIRCPGYPEQALEDLSVKDLKEYIAARAVPRAEILNIKIVHEPEGAPKYSQGIKESIDFILDDERVLLSGGRWMRFNQDYIDFLDEYIDGIEVQPTESHFRHIGSTEPEFNASSPVCDAGYQLADKDYSIFRTRRSTPIEAWDLRKGDCVYAVKFGTAQKLGYVCDQATIVLELLRNRAGVKQVPQFSQYCLWLGYRAKKDIDAVSQTGSMILKQKIETWARKARELGITPAIKLSRKVKMGIDV